MTNNRRYNHFVIIALILIMGLGLALALPWLANAQSLAADEKQNKPSDYADVVHSAELAYALAAEGNGNTPTLDLCFATHNDGTDVFSELDASAVQQAVDAASSGDTVKVAGTCIGVQNRAGLTQTVYISKSLTLEGGHTESNWTLEPDPETYTTTLYANNLGRVIVISGTQGVTLDSLFLEGGLADANLLEAGGGIWSNGAMTLTNSIVYSNTSPSFAGGMFNDENSTPVLHNVTFIDNKAGFYGGGMYNFSISPTTMTNVNFFDNKAGIGVKAGSGGGMYNDRSSPTTMTNVTFSGNSATSNGGGMINNRSSPTMTNVTFSGNSATSIGGGLINDTSSPAMTNITFSGNLANIWGGGLVNGNSNPVIINSLFSGNKSKGYGGGIFESGSGSTLINVTFSGNSATIFGGGMFNASGSTTDVSNGIFWNNQANGITGTITATIFNDNSTITLTHSLVEGSGGTGNWALDPTSYVDGGGNIDTNPMFITPVDPSTAPTLDGNLWLQSSSPAIDAGDNYFVPPDVLTDLEGEPRIVDGNWDGTPTVDMGAYETQIYCYLPLIYR